MFLNGWIDGWLGWMDGWIDRQILLKISPLIFGFICWKCFLYTDSKFAFSQLSLHILVLPFIMVLPSRSMRATNVSPINNFKQRKFWDFIFFFYTSFRISSVFFHLHYISVHTRNISNTQEPHVASGCYIGWLSSRQWFTNLAEYQNHRKLFQNISSYDSLPISWFRKARKSLQQGSQLTSDHESDIWKPLL